MTCRTKNEPPCRICGRACRPCMDPCLNPLSLVWIPVNDIDKWYHQVNDIQEWQDWYVPKEYIVKFVLAGWLVDRASMNDQHLQ